MFHRLTHWFRWAAFLTTGMLLAVATGTGCATIDLQVIQTGLLAVLAFFTYNLSSNM